MQRAKRILLPLLCVLGLLAQLIPTATAFAGTVQNADAAPALHALSCCSRHMACCQMKCHPGSSGIASRCTGGCTCQIGNPPLTISSSSTIVAPQPEEAGMLTALSPVAPPSFTEAAVNIASSESGPPKHPELPPDAGRAPPFA